MVQNKANVLVVEDHAVVGEALTQFINRQRDLVCCGTIDNLGAILHSVGEHLPDVLILDLILKKEDATSLVPIILAQFPQTRLLVFSQLDSPAQVSGILKAGARGFITKEESIKEILAAIRTVLRGEIYLSQKMAARLLQKFVETKPDTANPARATELPLTHREAQVFQMIGSGRKTGEIASTLKLSVKTIESHRENIKRKLGIQTASQLVHRAIDWVENRVPLAGEFKPKT